MGRERHHHEASGRGRGQKHSGHQAVGLSGMSGLQQNSWGPKRSESSLWLLLINGLSKKSLLPVREDFSKLPSVLLFLSCFNVPSFLPCGL